MNSHFLRLSARVMSIALLATGCNSQVFVSEEDMPSQPEDVDLWPNENVRIELESPAPEALILSGLGNMHASVWIPGDSVASVIDTEEPIAPFGAQMECVSRQIDLKIETADTSSSSPAITVSLDKWFVPKDSKAQLTVCYAYSRKSFNFNIPACPIYNIEDYRYTTNWEIDSIGSATHEIVDQITINNNGNDSVKISVFPYKNTYVTALFQPADNTPLLPVDSALFINMQVPLPSGEKFNPGTDRYFISYIPDGNVTREIESKFLLPEVVSELKATITVPPQSHRIYYLFVAFQIKSVEYNLIARNTVWTNVDPEILSGKLTVFIPYDFLVAYNNL